MSIKLTEPAVEQVRRAAVDAGADELALRIAARRREDGSIEYAMGFDEAVESDISREYDRLMVVVAPTSVDLLSGAVLDFVEIAPGEHQFIFLNPNDPDYVPPDPA